MFGIGTPELILLLFVALAVIGPKKLPRIAQAVGKGMGELRRSLSTLNGLARSVTLEGVWEQLGRPAATDSDEAPEGELQGAAAGLARDKGASTPAEAPRTESTESAGRRPDAAADGDERQ